MIKTEYKFGEPIDLESTYTYSDEKVGFSNLFGNENGGVAVLAFKAGQQLAEHLAPAEVMVMVMDGDITFTMNGMTNQLRRNEFLLMGCGVPHSVKANADSKVMLIKIKP